MKEYETHTRTHKHTAQEKDWMKLVHEVDPKNTTASSTARFHSVDDRIVHIHLPPAEADG